MRPFSTPPTLKLAIGFGFSSGGLSGGGIGDGGTAQSTVLEVRLPVVAASFTHAFALQPEAFSKQWAALADGSGAVAASAAVPAPAPPRPPLSGEAVVALLSRVGLAASTVENAGEGMEGAIARGSGTFNTGTITKVGATLCRATTVLCYHCAVLRCGVRAPCWLPAGLAAQPVHRLLLRVLELTD